MKYPPRKNKQVNTSKEIPNIDERNLIGSSESSDLSIEDRIALYWEEKKAFIIGCFALLAAFIVLVNGFRIYKQYRENSLQAAYTKAIASDTPGAFAKTNADTKLGGFAALNIADEAFEAEDYAKAIEFYKIAAQALSHNPLAGRAALGQAFALYHSGEKDAGLVTLENIIANNQFPESIRAEAAYHLAVDAFIAKRTEVFQSYADQIGDFDQAQQWNQRLQYYVQQN